MKALASVGDAVDLRRRVQLDLRARGAGAAVAGALAELALGLVIEFWVCTSVIMIFCLQVHGAGHERVPVLILSTREWGGKRVGLRLLFGQRLQVGISNTNIQRAENVVRARHGGEVPALGHAWGY